MYGLYNKDLLLSNTLNEHRAELVQIFIKTKTAKRIHIKMSNFKIKQKKNMSKMKLI